MSKPKVKLTKTSIEALPVPATGQAFHWDSHTPGFGVRVTAKGAKSFVVQGRVNGKTCRFTIAPCRLIGVDEARKRALARLLDMHDGKNPTTERKRQAAQGLTLRQVMESYIANKRTRHGPLRPASKADIQRCVTTVFANWADRPVTEITREACIKRFRELSDQAPAQANQVFRNLRALLNWARETHTADDGTPTLLAVNPVTQAFKKNGPVQWNAERSRKEKIPRDKIGAVWSMLVERTNPEVYSPADITAAHLVQFLILTGARIGEATRLKWYHVRLDDAVPSFTFTETKNHNVVTLPMSTAMHQLLTTRHGTKRKGQEYVFPSRTNPKSYMKDARGTMERVSEVAGLHLHNHDLRRTFIDVAIACGIEIWKAELLTNHVPQSVTLTHYTETEDLRYLRPEVQQVANFIEAPPN